MRRVLWIAVGVGATVIVIRKFGQVRGIAVLATPAGIGNAINNLAESLSELTKEFRESMSAHEQALTDALIKGEGKAANPQWGVPGGASGQGRAQGTSRSARGGSGAYDLDDAFLEEVGGFEDSDGNKDFGSGNSDPGEDEPRHSF